MILDTNFVIDILRGKDRAVEKLGELKQRQEPLILPPGALFELHVGAGEDESLKKIEEDLEGADLTSGAERKAAKIRRDLEDQGKPISSIDYLIAGTAIDLEQDLLTRDSQFERVEGLEVEKF
jgi:predicted nucleic acid-binding protein